MANKFKMNVSVFIIIVGIPVKYLLHTPITPYDPIAENMVDAKEAGKYNWPSSFKTPSIPFVNDQGPRLWGMTLRMTQDILDIPVTGHTIQIDEDDKVQVTTDKSKL
jgi:hypothetical protein